MGRGFHGLSGRRNTQRARHDGPNLFSRTRHQLCSQCSPDPVRRLEAAAYDEPIKHPNLGVDDVYDVWRSDPLFYPAKPPAHWLMVADVAGRVLVVPLASPDSGDATRCRPIGCYVAAAHLATRYREDR